MAVSPIFAGRVINLRLDAANFVPGFPLTVRFVWLSEYGTAAELDELLAWIYLRKVPECGVRFFRQMSLLRRADYWQLTELRDKVESRIISVSGSNV